MLDRENHKNIFKNCRRRLRLTKLFSIVLYSIVGVVSGERIYLVRARSSERANLI